MLTSGELFAMIEQLEDEGMNLQFNEIMIQLNHSLRPDVPITIYIGGTWEEQNDFDGIIH